MTIEEPPEDADIDWETVCAAGDQAGELARAGTLTVERFRELWAQAKAAAGEHLEVLETLRMFAPPSLNPDEL